MSQTAEQVRDMLLNEVELIEKGEESVVLVNVTSVFASDATAITEVYLETQLGILLATEGRRALGYISRDSGMTLVVLHRDNRP